MNALIALLACLISAVAMGPVAMAQDDTSGADAGQAGTEQPGRTPGKEMSIEELEAYLEQRRSELEAAEEDREKVKAEAAEVRKAMDERKAELTKIQNELESLCKESEEVSAGSFDQCMAANGEAAKSKPGTKGESTDNDESDGG